MQGPFDIAADLDTPVSAYLKLRPLKPHYLLESVERGSELARYSFLGFGEASTVTLDDKGLHINGTTRPRPTGNHELLDVLRDVLKNTAKPKPVIDELPFCGGLVGVTGYDVVRQFETLPQRPAPQKNVPEVAYVATSSLLVFDHLTRRLALLHAGSEEERQALRADIKRLLSGPLPRNGTAVELGTATGSLTKKEFTERVATCKEYIAAGDIYQIVMSVLFRGRTNVDPFQVYRALRLLNPSPYMFFCEFGDLKIAGSSPEALVRLNGTRAALRPIAGTLPRGDTDAEDRDNERRLLADPKEIAEHVMLVDLARNDLGRVAKTGTVRVEPYLSIERYSHVMHIVSGVQGQIDERFDALDLFAAAFPAGTLVGAPKVRAMQIIDQLEPVGRGLYAGTAGYFSYNGDMDQAITIRTLVFNGDEYSYQAGAGIVADSIAENEYAEVLAKSAILRRALEIAAEGL